MAGVQAIIDRIVFDANEQAKSIIGTARRQIAENEKKADEQIRAQQAVIQKQTELDCREEERRAGAMADLETRKGALKEKRSAIALAFERARQTVMDLPKEEYASFLFGLLQKSGAEGGVIFCSKKDRPYFTEDFLQRAKKEISAGLSLGDVSETIESGFILINGEAQINCTVDFVFKQAREALEGDVARILFGGGD